MRPRFVACLFYLVLPASVLALAPLYAGSVAEPQHAAEQPASAAQDPLAELTRQVREKPDRFSYVDLSLAVAREIYHDLEGEKVEAFKKDLDDLAARVRESIKASQQAQEKVARANAVLFQDRGLKCAESTQPEQEVPDYYFPHSTLARKKGVCLGLTTLYLCVAERAGLPMCGAHAPQHIFVRYDDGESSVNLETTDGGRVFDLASYLARFKEEDRPRLQEVYFKNLTKLEVLGDLFNAAAWCSSIGTARNPLPPERALLAARLCVEICPQDYNNWDTLAQAYLYAKQPQEALRILRKAIGMRPPAVGSYDERYWDGRLKRFMNFVQSEGK